MEPTMDWMTIQRDGSPLYQQVMDQIVDAIDSGVLLPGARLPAERVLAHTLGVSRTTTLTAYAELAARGLVRRQVGRGTFVSARPERHDAPFAWRGKVATGALRTQDRGLKSLAATASQTGLISFAAAVPASDVIPVDVLGAITDRLLRSRSNQVFELAPAEGMPALRETLAHRFQAAARQTLVLNGAMQGLDLISRCLIDPGDVIVMDRPGYIGAIQTFRASGAMLAGWDFQSGDLDSLEDLLVRYRPKFIYTTPTFQNPTGQTMSAATRKGLLDVAARYRVAVVEDDPYRDLSFSRPVPRSMRVLDSHQLVIQIGTFSKSIAGGLRLGWLIANEMIIEQLALQKLRNDLANPTLQQLMVAEFLTSGEFDRHLQRLRDEHARRYSAIKAAIKRWLSPGMFSYEPVDGGMYLWCRYQMETDAAELLIRARALDVAFLNGEACFPDSGGHRQLRLCFSSVTPERIETGIQRIAGLLHEA